MFKKFASFEDTQILDVRGSQERVKTASLSKLSDFDQYRTDQGFLYARIRAISSRTNKNHDGWPSVELAGGDDAFDRISKTASDRTSFVVEADRGAKYGYSTFLGKPVFIDHNNDDPDRARGVIVDAKLHIEDNKTSSLDPYYATAPDNHKPETWVELLLEIDAKSFPRLAKAILEGSRDSSKGIDGFSMGADVTHTRCSLPGCHKIARSPDEFCEHVRLKGAEFSYIDPKTGSKKRQKVWEDCYGVQFFEISAVFDPADETALLRELIHKEGSTKQAAAHCTHCGADMSMWDDDPSSPYIICPECRGVNNKNDLAPEYVPQPPRVPGVEETIHDIRRLPETDERNSRVASDNDRWLEQQHQNQLDDVNCPECGGIMEQGGLDASCPECGHYIPDLHEHLYDPDSPEDHHYATAEQKMLSAIKLAPGDKHLPGASPKRNRQYEHIKQDYLDSGKSEDEAKELAARTVNKQRAEHGETKSKVSSVHESIVKGTDFHDIPDEDLREPVDCQRCGEENLKPGEPCPNCGFPAGEPDPSWGDPPHDQLDDPWNQPHGYTSSMKTAENPLPQSDLLHAPEEVDTLRDEKPCPVCGSMLQESTCPICGYVQEPDGFDNPDLSKAQEEKGSFEDQSFDPNTPALEQQPQQPSPDQGLANPNSLQTRNPSPTSRVNSDMSMWTLRVHPKVAGRINPVENPLSTSTEPATDEPIEEIHQDETQPVTSHALRTARTLIRAAKNKEKNMSNTKVAADAVPAAQPDVSTEVEGVGGVDQASNEEASKADGQVTVTDKGGTGVEDVSAEQENVNVAQGDEHSKNVEEIPTQTWSDGKGDSLGQQDPVSDEVFPPSDEGVKATSAKQAYDSEPFPSEDGGLSGGSATQGVQPADSVGDSERVDVLQSTTTPDNNSGPTTTWTGTGGNKVLRQQDPVTNETLEGEDIVNIRGSSHIFSAMKLADLEVDLGLLNPDMKYDRIAELEAQKPEVVKASLEYAQRVKTAGLKRQVREARRLPSLSQAPRKEASSSSEDIGDESLFLGHR